MARTIADVIEEKRKTFIAATDEVLAKYAEAYDQKIEELTTDLRFCVWCREMVDEEQKRREFNARQEAWP